MSGFVRRWSEKTGKELQSWRYEYVACDTCGEVQEVRVPVKGKRCIMTPRCKGKLNYG